jgi:two-component system, NarL family, nitrate/nitrite response regulator NarL
VSKNTSIVIVSPKVLLREGIASLLQNSCYKVIASAAGPAELPAYSRPKGQQTLAIVGMDRQTGNLDYAAESICLLRSLMPDTKVVLVLESDGPIDLPGTLNLSPDGCIFNLGSRDTLIKVLELASKDQHVFVFGKSIVATAKDQDEFSEPASSLQSPECPQLMACQTALSSREYQVLAYLAQGRSNKVIARLCNISAATVKVHLKTILRKTNTQNRTQAAIWALERGLRDHSLEYDGSVVVDAMALSPAREIPAVEYRDRSGVLKANQDDGLLPNPPSAHHPGLDRPGRRTGGVIGPRMAAHKRKPANPAATG